MAINLSGMFTNLGAATSALGESVKGPALPEDPNQRNAMQRAGVTNPMLQMFGQGLGGAFGAEMRSPEAIMKESMATVDMESPEGLLQMAQRLKQYDPISAAKLLQAYEQMKTDRYKAALTSKGSAKGISTSEGQMWEDPQGNVYQTIYKTNKDTDTIETVYLPQGNAPEYDGKQKLKMIITSGDNVSLDPFAAANLRVGAAVKQDRQTKYNQTRLASLDAYPNALQQRDRLVRSLELLKEANLSGGVSGAAKKFFYEFTGTMPQDLAELNKLFNEATYSRLRDLFGSQITEGERQAVLDTFTSISKGSGANEAIIESLMRDANAALAKHELYYNNDTLEGYESALGRMVEESKGRAAEAQSQATMRWDPVQKKLVPIK